MESLRLLTPRGESQFNIGAIEPPPGETPNFENPYSQGPRLIVSDITLLVVGATFVAARLCTRAFVTRSLGADDVFCVLALVGATVFCASDVIGARYGSGTHLWNVSIPTLITNLKASYWGLIFYVLAIYCIKMSILFLYLRLFKTVRHIRYTAYALWVYMTGYHCAIVFAIMFGCSPISKYWDVTITTGHCINLPALGIAGASFSVMTDVIILTLPMYTVWNLKLPTRQRGAVAGTFLLGGFVTAASAVRIYYLVIITRDPDFTWASTPSSLWCSIEINMSIVVSCLPILRPLVPMLSSSITRKLYGSRTGRSEKSGSSYAPSRSKKSSAAANDSNASGFPIKSFEGSRSHGDGAEDLESGPHGGGTVPEWQDPRTRFWTDAGRGHDGPHRKDGNIVKTMAYGVSTVPDYADEAVSKERS
ncbi:MAG: hypothetical protein M1817_001867 [Caeruleum heppii]|nr:MAG: hypothetical protein M1817_001867 [Caeruleum heppii]